MTKIFTAVIEKDSDTKLYVGYIPGFPGAHSQGQTLNELQENLREVVAILLENRILCLKPSWLAHSKSLLSQYEQYPDSEAWSSQILEDGDPLVL